MHFCVWLLIVLAGPVRTPAEPVLADEIVAVVDDAIILRSDVMGQLALEAMRRGVTREQLVEGGQAEVLFREILDNMIQDELLLAKAREDSLEAPSDMVNEQVRARMRELKAQQGPEAFAGQLLEEGLTEREVRDKLRQNFRKDILRQMIYGRLVREISVSARDAESFRSTYQGELPPYYSLSHIMVSARASDEQAARAKERIEAVQARLRAGEDFAEVARATSEDPASAAHGGDLGFFGRGTMVPEFEEVAFRLGPGEVSDIIQSDFGFHILRVEEKDGDRVRARHVLIALRPGEADQSRAYQEAVRLYERVKNGEDFTELAKEHSDHRESAENGGKLGTYTKDQPPPGFTDALAGLGLGGVTSPVQTEFGWHVVKVEDSPDAIEELVKQMKIQDHFERVLSEVRAKLYIDVRM